MEIKAGWGVAGVLFGMTQVQVEQVLGKPTTTFTDDDDNSVWVYTGQNLRLSFYADEDFKLALIATNHPNATINGVKVFDTPMTELLKAISPQGKWEIDTFDSVVTYSQEDTWVTVIEDMGRINRIEFGAWFSEKSDDFLWRI